MKAKLTVLIPCKNEARNIRACIESVQGIADEILIADSGSVDQTLPIVHGIGGCRVVQREYINSTNFKNWAIPQARHEWVLIVDADERVTPMLAREIVAILASEPRDFDGFWIGRLNHFLGHPIRHCGWSPDEVLRLFRRDRGRYALRHVHGEIVMDATRTGRLREPFLHYTSWNSETYLQKLNRYTMWGAMNLRDEGKRPRAWKMFQYACFRFLHLYVIRRGFLDGAAGLYVCGIGAFYGFLKQARLWELEHAIPQSQIEPSSIQEQETGRAEPTSHGKIAAPHGPIAAAQPALAGHPPRAALR